MKRSEELMERLKELNAKRKSGELSARDYYRGLMDLLMELANALKEEDISDEDVKKQIPLLKVFISEQIKKMSGRGH
jgi:NTP pyrophosphatase (non-canonical NTP hydrolase)